MMTNRFIFTLFGATGDLAMGKLIPALFKAFCYDKDVQDGYFVFSSRGAFSRDAFLNHLTNKMKDVAAHPKWQDFLAQSSYVTLDATKEEDYASLGKHISFLDDRALKIFYLSTAPDFFKPICKGLASASLHSPHSRIVLEKPLGHNLRSNQDINAFVKQFFTEQQIFRIDHYLGKDSVQNIMALRFGNVLFEPLWRREWIDHIQITIAESDGIGDRGQFYDGTGALQDMVQNHLLQLVCFLAMEPPISLHPDAIRDEKLKVLKSLSLYDSQNCLSEVVRGQYRSGKIGDQNVVGYLDENHISDHSRTETFIALRLFIANWRWAGVPFYLRTGKRLPERVAEMSVHFKNPPHNLYQNGEHHTLPNRLVMRLQPEETMRLHFLAKPFGAFDALKPVFLNLDFTEQLKQRRPSAYERLIGEIMRGDLSLFVRQDEQEQAWRWIEPITKAIRDHDLPLDFYEAGSWGPQRASLFPF